MYKFAVSWFLLVYFWFLKFINYVCSRTISGPHNMISVHTVLRHYLELVENAKPRKALTRLLVSQHPLAVEQMRYKQRNHRDVVPRDRRMCRFGCNEVETVEHAFFFCKRSLSLAECVPPGSLCVNQYYSP